MVSRAFRIGGVLVLLVAALLLIIGGVQVISQHDRVTRYKPVTASIVESTVKVKRNRKSSSYTPMIEFSYEVGGRTYRSTRLLPASENWSKDSAYGIVGRNPRGANTQAYYDPASPGESFLEKHLSFQPYFVCVLGAAGVSAAAMLWFSGRRKPGHQKDSEPQLADGAEWWTLTPEYEMQRRLAKWRWASLALIALSAIPFHYLNSAWPDTGRFSLGCGIVYGVATLCCMACWMHAASVNRRFVDPVVLIDRPDPMVGEQFTLRIAVSVLKGVSRGELIAGIICREGYKEKHGNKTVYGERTAHEYWLPPEPIAELAADGVVSSDFILGAPAGARGTTDAGLKGTVYPNYTWLIGVKVKVRGGADLNARYPIVIADAADALTVSDAPEEPE